MSLLVAAFVLCSSVVLKAATSSETPETAVLSYLENLKSQAFEKTSTSGEKFTMTAANGEPVRDAPYVTNILLVKAQPGPERVANGESQTWRVLYAVETKLPQEFVQRRLAFLQKERIYKQKVLRNKPKEDRQRIDEVFQGSIERVRTGRYIVYATAIVKRTATGWELPRLAAAQIDVDLQAWALDNYWEPTNPYTTKVTGFAKETS